MNSPFKFLDAYTREDRAWFFGREAETEALYQMVAQNRLMLIYGQSGSGKTSLIQCGLAGKFDTTDWYPLYFRRQNDINATVQQRLEQLTPGLRGATIPGRLSELYLQSLRPVYLIFDQLEELFILGHPDEQSEFAALIQSILATSIPCRILLIIREEYLAQLYQLEKTLPMLFDRRLRVEPMGRNKVKQVLEGSFRHFNITVPATNPPLTETIIDNISAGKLGVQLPYLQVYLDRMYRAHAAGLPESAAGPAAGNWPALRLHPEKIDALGKIEHVLDSFLSEQAAELQSEMAKRYPHLPPDSVSNVLDGFATEEGTKRPFPYTWQADQLLLEPRLANMFAPLTPAELGFCCKALERRRLLRFSDEHMELAHDTLAAVIDQKRSAAQRRINELYNRILSQYREFRLSGELLSRRQINTLEEHLDVLKPRLEPAVLAFYEKSLEYALRTEQAELWAERQKRRRARRIAVIGFALAAVAAGALLVALFQFNAKRKEERGKAFEKARAMKYDGRYAVALSFLDFVKTGFGKLPEGDVKKVDTLFQKWRLLVQLMPEADSLRALGRYPEALIKYRIARQTDSDSRIETKVAQTEKELEEAFERLSNQGTFFMTARKYALAAEKFEQALSLKPGDTLVLEKLQVCRAHQ